MSVEEQRSNEIPIIEKLAQVQEVERQERIKCAVSDCKTTVMSECPDSYIGDDEAYCKTKEEKQVYACRPAPAENGGKFDDQVGASFVTREITKFE